MEITPSVESSGKAWCQSRRPGRFLRTNTRRENQLRYIYGIPFHAILLLNFFDYLFPAITFSYLQGFFFITILKRMYAIYKQTHPPTGIEHCVYCQFFSPAENNLVVAGTSQLRIYKFYTQDEVGDGLRESFSGDFSCCIIENILLDYQV